MKYTCVRCKGEMYWEDTVSDGPGEWHHKDALDHDDFRLCWNGEVGYPGPDQVVTTKAAIEASKQAISDNLDVHSAAVLFLYFEAFNNADDERRLEVIDRLEDFSGFLKYHRFYVTSS